MISLRLVYLARLREAFEISGETLEIPAESPTVGDVVALLRERGAPWSYELAEGRAVRVAVNHEMAGLHTSLRTHDELAFFPPVTGG
ncbi:MAG: molybdopterin converting factor subunit 1 [Burkholderiales bacterium]|jgi:molybdopterin synthase sulfur carrier subunit|nr:molybdopterin converting factor subunit 1 [Burkholderiales bacterium]